MFDDLALTFWSSKYVFVLNDFVYTEFFGGLVVRLLLLHEGLLIEKKVVFKNNFEVVFICFNLGMS